MPKYTHVAYNSLVMAKPRTQARRQQQRRNSNRATNPAPPPLVSRPRTADHLLALGRAVLAPSLYAVLKSWNCRTPRSRIELVRYHLV